jgi:hypothetical protein
VRTVKLLWGIIVVTLSLLAWGSEFITWVAPRAGARFHFTASDDTDEPSYWIDFRGEAPFASVTLWTMVVAGILMILDVDEWAYFGLVGGGMYIYFAGGAIFTRIAARRAGVSPGGLPSQKMRYTLLVLWAVMGLITIAAAVASLQPV